MAGLAMVLDPKPLPEPPASIPSIMSDLQGYTEQSLASDEDDLYRRLKSYKRQLEFIDIQEEYVKDELKNLKRENFGKRWNYHLPTTSYTNRLE
ncbi:hypothetical protein ACFX2K_029322 [Malus domestica]